jgi:hypothetical protein
MQPSPWLILEHFGHLKEKLYLLAILLPPTPTPNHSLIYLCKIFLFFMHKNRNMKPVEIVLRRGQRRQREGIEGVDMHCMHVQKYHKEILLYN